MLVCCLISPHTRPTPDQRMAHHVCRAICAFTIAILALISLIFFAKSTFPPYTLKEIIYITAYTGVAGIFLIHSIVEVILARRAFEEIR